MLYLRQSSPTATSRSDLLRASSELVPHFLRFRSLLTLATTQRDLFRFATKFELFLNAIGILAAIVAGALS